MPKSKRDKKISLTKTDKKGLALKQQIIEEVKRCVEKYSSIYVFSVENMRNIKMKEIRQDWKPSKFLFGKNKIIALGLGTTPENEADDDLHKLSTCLKGQCGILFTDEKKDYVTNWFDTYEVEDYARTGFKANKTISLNAGPLKQFPHSIEPYLRQLGMPTSLDRGIIQLLKDYEICKEGNLLTPEQAKILKLLEYKLAKFKLILKGVWERKKGFTKLKSSKTDDTETEEMDADDVEDNESEDDEAEAENDDS